MIESFLIKPFLAIILIAISCSLSGVFILWKKISYFGDALSHAILLGLALGVVFTIDPRITLIIFAIIFAILTSVISRNRYFSKDAIIMILAYFSIALAVLINDISGQNIRFTTFIFGDVLTVSSQDLWLILAATISVISYFIFSFKKILLISISEDLAKVENINSEFWKISFLILLSILIAIFVKIVGIFLMTSLLILPAAIARIFSSSAQKMLFLSLICGITISILSFNIATFYNLTISSTIIAVFSSIFLISLLAKNFLIKND